MSPEVIALVAVIGTTVSGILTTLFHSRCSKINCWGITCDREVIHTKEETDLDRFEKENNVNINPEIKQVLENNIQN
tara:strand:- start:457 stop:687 length:231 start_codon:yes stop_codon:yes gene_type:complete